MKTKKNINILSSNMIIVCLFTFFITSSIALAQLALDVEETGDTVLSYDTVIEGTMQSYSDSSIEVDEISYSLCEGVVVFNNINMIIPQSDLANAEVIKIFNDNRKNCVRKIKVIKFNS
jgi:hypothetical protein